MASFITLFSNILQNPQDPRARSDFTLMKSVQEFIHALSQSKTENSENTFRMNLFVQEFVKIAGLVLEKAEKESHGRRRRKAEDKMDVTMQKDKAQQRPRSGQTPAVEANGRQAPFGEATSGNVPPANNNDVSITLFPNQSTT
jgi:hypothetical protein